MIIYDWLINVKNLYTNGAYQLNYNFNSKKWYKWEIINHFLVYVGFLYALTKILQEARSS